MVGGIRNAKRAVEKEIAPESKRILLANRELAEIIGQITPVDTSELTVHTFVLLQNNMEKLEKIQNCLRAKLDTFVLKEGDFEDPQKTLAIFSSKELMEKSGRSPQDVYDRLCEKVDDLTDTMIKNISDYAEMYASSGLRSKVTLVVEDRKFCIDKLRLMKKSIMFERMLLTSMKESRENVITLQEVRADVFAYYCDYIINGTCSDFKKLCGEDLYDFLVMIDKYQTKTEIINHLQEQLVSQDCFPGLTFSEENTLVFRTFTLPIRTKGFLSAPLLVRNFKEITFLFMNDHLIEEVSPFLSYFQRIKIPIPNQLTKKGWDEFKKLSQDQILQLSHVPVSSDLIELLEGVPNLLLDNVTISAQLSRKSIDVLKNLHPDSYLYLLVTEKGEVSDFRGVQCRLELEGDVSCRKLVEIAPNIPLLVNLESTRGDMTDEALDTITTHCPSIQIVSLPDCRALTNEGARSIGRLSELVELDLSLTRYLDSYRGEVLAGEFYGITNEGLAHWGHLTNLQNLCLVRREISDEGISHLRELRELRKLELYGCTQISGGVFEYLSGFHELRLLDVSEEDVDIKNTVSDDLAHISQLHKLEYLDLDSHSRLDDRVIPHLMELTNLKTLILSGTEVSRQSLQVLPYFDQLETVETDED